MPLLVDMSNLSIGALQEACAGSKDKMELCETSVRHIILKKLVETHKKIGRHHQLVLCFDSRNYWRKDYFPHYKGNRSRSADSQFSWEDFYRLYNDFKAELPQYFNYKCIEIERCEADDVIFCVSEHLEGKDVVIASSDTDDLQILEKWNDAMQYSFKKRKFITCEDYNYTLNDHIIEGDSGDGIPSIISDADTYMVKEKRSKPLTVARRASLKLMIPDEYMGRYKQNEQIIDMSKIPDNYRQQIIESYLAPMPKRTGKPYDYCLKYRLSELLKVIA